MSRSAAAFVLGTAGWSLAVAEALLLATQSIARQVDMLSGWALAMAGHTAAILLLVRFIDHQGRLNVLAGLGGIITRLFVLIIFLLIVLLGAFLEAIPVVIGMLTAYFIGSWREIAWVMRQGDSC